VPVSSPDGTPRPLFHGCARPQRFRPHARSGRPAGVSGARSSASASLRRSERATPRPPRRSRLVPSGSGRLGLEHARFRRRMRESWACPTELLGQTTLEASYPPLGVATDASALAGLVRLTGGSLRLRPALRSTAGTVRARAPARRRASACVGGRDPAPARTRAGRRRARRRSRAALGRGGCS
jgi:hypothetical protein